MAAANPQAVYAARADVAGPHILDGQIPQRDRPMTWLPGWLRQFSSEGLL